MKKNLLSIGDLTIQDIEAKDKRLGLVQKEAYELKKLFTWEELESGLPELY